MKTSLDSSAPTPLPEGSPKSVTSPLLTRLGIPHGFTTRLGGVSPAPYDSLNFGLGLGDTPENVRANYDLLRRSVPAASRPFAGVTQVHGNTCFTLAEGDPRMPPDGPGPEADALLTPRRDCVVAVRTADCVPVLIAGESWVAAVHAGWRGTAMGVVGRAVGELSRASGRSPGSLVAAIGPAICVRCYAVGPDVEEAVRKASGGGTPGGTDPVLDSEAASQISVRGADPEEGSPNRVRYHVNLVEANRRQLLLAGLAPDSIDHSVYCTSCDSTVFFSHRREKGHTGRMLSFIGLP